MSDEKQESGKVRVENITLGGITQPLIDALNNLGHLFESAGRYLDAKTKLINKELKEVDAKAASEQQSHGLKEVNKRVNEVIEQQRISAGRLAAVEKRQKSWRDEKSQSNKFSVVQNPQVQPAEPQHAKIEEPSMNIKPEVKEKKEHKKFSNNALAGLQHIVASRAE